MVTFRPFARTERSLCPEKGERTGPPALWGKFPLRDFCRFARRYKKFSLLVDAPLRLGARDKVGGRKIRQSSRIFGRLPRDTSPAYEF